MAIEKLWQIADDYIVSSIVPVAREVWYFRNLRWSFEDHTLAEIGVPTWDYGILPPTQHGVTIVNDTPLVSWFLYKNPPPPEEDPFFSPLRWLFLCNRDQRSTTAHVTFSSISPYSLSLRRLEFPSFTLGEKVPIHAGDHTFNLDAWDMDLYALDTWP